MVRQPQCMHRTCREARSHKSLAVTPTAVWGGGGRTQQQPALLFRWQTHKSNKIYFVVSASWQILLFTPTQRAAVRIHSKYFRIIIILKGYCCTYCCIRLRMLDDPVPVTVPTQHAQHKKTMLGAGRTAFRESASNPNWCGLYIYIRATAILPAASTREPEKRQRRRFDPAQPTKPSFPKDSLASASALIKPALITLSSRSYHPAVKTKEPASQKP